MIFDGDLLQEEIEKNLYELFLACHWNTLNFEKTLSSFSKLIPLINAFFESVTINADNIKIKNNRLALIHLILNSVRSLAQLEYVQE
jgi:glycyl-tRNA synthetase beta subunit